MSLRAQLFEELRDLRAFLRFNISSIHSPEKLTHISAPAGCCAVWPRFSCDTHISTYLTYDFSCWPTWSFWSKKLLCTGLPIRYSKLPNKRAARLLIFQNFSHHHAHIWHYITTVNKTTWMFIKLWDFCSTHKVIWTQRLFGSLE